MDSTSIILFKPHIKNNVPELFCYNLETFNNYSHIRVMTNNFPIFIQTLSTYLVNKRMDYGLWIFNLEAIFKYNGKATIISSELSEFDNPIDLLFFDSMLPSKYPDGENIPIISMIRTYNDNEYKFYNRLITSKRIDYNIDNTPEYTEFYIDKPIHFFDLCGDGGAYSIQIEERIM